MLHHRHHLAFYFVLLIHLYKLYKEEQDRQHENSLPKLPVSDDDIAILLSTSNRQLQRHKLWVHVRSDRWIKMTLKGRMTRNSFEQLHVILGIQVHFQD